MTVEDPVVITVAPTGPLTTRDQHPAVPLSPKEIAIAVAEAHAAGAAVAHVHARDDVGQPTASSEVYAAIISAIEDQCDIVIQVSTGVGLEVSCEERLSIFDNPGVTAPMATLNPASMTFGNGTFANPPWFVNRMAELMSQRRIHPELEVYDVGHVQLCLELIARGLFGAPLHFSFVMGVRGGMPGHPALLPTLVSMLPEETAWQAIGIGRAQWPLITTALALGGNIRVGFEDNIYRRRGELAGSNAELVERAAQLVALAGREVATSDGVRARLRLDEQMRSHASAAVEPKTKPSGQR